MPLALPADRCCQEPPLVGTTSPPSLSDSLCLLSIWIEGIRPDSTIANRHGRRRPRPPAHSPCRLGSRWEDRRRPLLRLRRWIEAGGPPRRRTHHRPRLPPPRPRPCCHHRTVPILLLNGRPRASPPSLPFNASEAPASASLSFPLSPYPTTAPHSCARPPSPRPGALPARPRRRAR